MEYSSEKDGVSYRVTHFVRDNEYFSFDYQNMDTKLPLNAYLEALGAR